MKIKFITDTETLSEINIQVDETDEVFEETQHKLDAYDKHEIQSLTYEFVEGTKVEDTTDPRLIQPQMVSQLIIKVKKETICQS